MDNAITLRRIHCSVCSIRPIPVLQPLTDVAMHIIEAPGIRLLLANGMRLPTGIISIPGILPQLTYVVAKTISRRRPGPGCVFPFCLRRQTVLRPTYLCVQPAEKFLHVVPGDVFH